MKFIVWGPDGIPICDRPFATRAAAESGIEEFVSRFRQQGYYAGVGYRLELEEIAGRCTIMTSGATSTTPVRRRSSRAKLGARR
jgi:hypothetical protein